ncbi:MAG TPA: iron-containing alcohol dehydrogenase [Aliidongia sp.]|uniref:iron-containing alcohol dehydrogenase n=1 Tax=Aliidongia sp. TaxID=1914230 RepID=UPI002DDD72E1|nr:iron-containing alcohol dehydrogenase [Aliidongia sp.]HEV2676904.1 iron-containing alcohol dehydrogenase [Aliidongia sp.]
MIANITLPRQMVIGGGALKELPGLLGRVGITKPLIVTDPFMRDSGRLAGVTDLLDAAGIAWGVFADTVPDPTTEVIEIGARQIVDGDYDGLVALGGGSPIDTAKAMAILAANGGKMRDYKVPAPIPVMGLPLVAIPTTAGTGSEVTRFTVITDTETDEKMLIAGISATAVATIIDYELTLSMPLRLTADTGIDALTHAIEAYVSKRANLFSDSMALSAMKLIWAHLPIVCAEPGNHAAREAMMLGATQAGMAFSNASVALVHGMSRPIGAFFHVPHGLSNAMLLPEITAFSAPAAMPRYAQCAHAMGLSDPAEGDQAAVARLIDALRQINRDLSVPSPERYGIDRKRYHDLAPTMAQQALASGSPGNNPRVPTIEEMVALYERCYA